MSRVSLVSIVLLAGILILVAFTRREPAPVGQVAANATAESISNEPAPAPIAANEASLACGGSLSNGVVIVYPEEAQCRWPLRVAWIRVRCSEFGGTAAPWIATSEGSYALTGFGASRLNMPLLSATDEIWIAGANLGPWADVARTLCE